MLNYIMWKLGIDNEKGQGMVEYGIIVAFIAVFCIAAFTNLGKVISNLITGITLPTAP